MNDGRDRKQARREEEHYPRGRRSERPIGTELGFGDGPRREGGCLAPGRRSEKRSAVVVWVVWLVSRSSQLRFRRTAQ